MAFFPAGLQTCNPIGIAISFKNYYDAGIPKFLCLFIFWGCIYN